MKQKLIVAGLPLLSSLWLALGVVIAARFYPNYSHLTQFMSELGATGSPAGGWVNWLVFFACEGPVLAFVWFAHQANRGKFLQNAGLLLVVVHALLLMVAALSPCDFECRAEVPSIAHTLHLLAGQGAYLAGLAGLAVLSFVRLRRVSAPARVFLASAPAVLGLALMVAMSEAADYVGLLQRLLEAVIYLWMIVVAWHLADDAGTTGAVSEAVSSSG